MSTKIFAVLNLSAESPQSDSVVSSAHAACARIHNLLDAGADFVDIGGRSSGSKTIMISDELEQSRLKAVFDLTDSAEILPLSLDTWSPETAIKFLNKIQVLNYTSTDFPEPFLHAVSAAKCKLVLNYSSALNPYALRSAECKPFNQDEVVRYFENKLELLQKNGVNVLAIDPNLGVWHRDVANAEKPQLQRKIIECIPTLKKIAPVFIVAPRIVAVNSPGTLNLELTKMILNQGVDYIRTHDLPQIKTLIQRG